MMKQNGTKAAYLTVYLTLTLTIVLSLCLALIEGTRQNAFFVEAECVTDVGLNSIFAEYHRELLEQYNLFAIDTSYGTTLPQVAMTEEHLTEYIERNLNTEDVFLDWLMYRDFMGMSLDKAQISRVCFLTDSHGAVFRRRAAEAVWDDKNLDLFKQFQGWMQVVDSEKLTKRDIAEEKKKLDKELESYDGKEIAISETDWIIIKVTNPTNALEKIRKKGILTWVVEDTASLSGKWISTSNLIQARIRAGSINKGNLVLEELSVEEKLLEKFFFQEYLLQYMGRYGRESEENVLSYQIEYLIAGNNSDLANLKSVVNAIFAVREVANTSYIVADQNNRMIAEALAAVLATAMGIPEIADILEWILLFGWAFAESLYDTKCLMDGGRVPLIKTSDTWHYSLDNALSLGPIVKDTSEESEGLYYEDYLRIFMYLQNEEILTMRAMNMVEADIRNTEGNEYFRLDGCVDSVEAVILMKSAYGYNCEITRQKGYGTQ